MAKVAYGKEKDIQSAIDEGTIQKGTLILTSDSGELYFYDLSGNLRIYEERYKFRSYKEAEDWINNHDTCKGQIITVHEAGKCHLCLVNYDKTLIPFTNMYVDKGDMDYQNFLEGGKLYGTPEVGDTYTLYFNEDDWRSNFWAGSISIDSQSLSLLDSASSVLSIHPNSPLYESILSVIGKSYKPVVAKCTAIIGDLLDPSSVELEAKIYYTKDSTIAIDLSDTGIDLDSAYSLSIMSMSSSLIIRPGDAVTWTTVGWKKFSSGIGGEGGSSTEDILASIEENYVAKEEGKGLSTNDFTNAYKERLESTNLGGNLLSASVIDEVLKLEQIESDEDSNASVASIKPNLFNINTSIKGFLSVSGVITAATGTAEITSDVIEVEPNKKYTVQTWFPASANASEPWIRVCFYDENYTLIHQATGQSPTSTCIIETTEDGGKYQAVKLGMQGIIDEYGRKCKYIRFSTRTYNNVLIKFEESWDMTPYCDYIDYSITDSIRDYDYIVKSVNHRGFNKAAPENTLSAFKASAKAGFKYVETDVAWTKDGVPVLLHDATINRTTGIPVAEGEEGIKLNTLSLEDVRDVRYYDFGKWFSPEFAGEKIPTFEEFIKLCKMLGLHPYIQVNSIWPDDGARAGTLISIVKKYNMLNNVTWIGYGPSDLNSIKEKLSNARLGLLVSTLEDDTLTKIQNLKTDDNEVFLDILYWNINDDNIQQFIDNDIPVEVYTVDERSIVRTIHPYVTGMTTDYTNCGKAVYHFGFSL